MCDNEFMFVESCPGGTIWDDIEKACSWPDQQATPYGLLNFISRFSLKSVFVFRISSC